MRAAGYMMKKDLFIQESGLNTNLLNLLCLGLSFLARRPRLNSIEPGMNCLSWYIFALDGLAIRYIPAPVQQTSHQL